MKRLLMMAIVVVVVLISSSAEAQFAYLYNPDTYIPHGYGGYSRNMPFGRIGYGHGRDRTLNRVTGYGGLALGAFQVLNQNSIDNRLVNNQISTTNRIVRMAEKDQKFRHQQSRAQNRTVLRRRPIVIQTETQNNENQKLRREIESLRLELERLKLQQLQQELEKAKK